MGLDDRVVGALNEIILMEGIVNNYMSQTKISWIN